MESSRRITSSPISTRRMQRFQTASATWMWCLLVSSAVETNTWPRFTLRRQSVASSGRSSMSRTMRCTSG